MSSSATLLRRRASHAADAPAGDARLVCEGLEGRTLMSVALDAQGWTVVTPSADSRIIYVSTAGDDATNDGLSPAAPLATISKARTLARNGFPDQILLRRGDTFVGQTVSAWNLSGRNADEPFVIGAYTDPARPSSARPKLATGLVNGIQFTTTTPVSHVYVLGVAFEAHTRNYREPPGPEGGGFTTAVRPEDQGSTYGLRVLGPVNNLHVEDSSFQYYRTNISIETSPSPSGGERPVTNVTIRRNQILDAYAPNVNDVGSVIENTSLGLYAGRFVNGLTVDGNVLSHNGWTPDNALGAVASIYSHNAYINANVSNFTFVNNVVADAASHGLQARAGGVVKDNLFLRNPIAMSYGYVNAAVRAGGVSGEVSGNVVLGTGRILESGRGWGLEISNLKAASQGGGTVVRNNVFANDLATGGEHAIKLDIGNVSNPSQDVGLNDLLLESNVVYSWARGMFVSSGFNNPSSSKYRPLTNLVVRGNDFQRLFAASGSGPLVDHAAPFVGSAEVWEGNRYDGTRTDSGTGRWFRVAGTLQTFDEWKANYEPTALRALGAFPDPGRTAGEYNATVGGANSTDAFVEQARRQSRSFWRPAYEAGPVNAFVRAGYAGGRIDTAAPTASALADNITLAGAATHRFTVTYSDDDQVDANSLGSNDVRVTGPNGFSAAASLVSSTGNLEGSLRTATYSVAAPGGAWSADANGLYSIVVQAGAVRDSAGKSAVADTIGSFSVTIDPAVPGAVASAPFVGGDRQQATVTVTYSGGQSPGLPTTVPIPNAGFETPNVGTGTDGYQYAPAGAEWTFAESAGIAGNGSQLTWPNIGAPQGQQVAFIQGPGTITQEVGNWAAGTYVLSIRGLQRGAANANPHTFDVEVDGGVVGTFTPTGSAYETFVTATFTVAAGAHTIRIAGLDVAGSENNVVLVDDVRISGTTTPAQQWIEADSLDAGDVQLTGPGGYVAGATVAVVDQPGVDGPQRVVTYTIPAPAGGWSSVARDATYPVNIVTGEVLTTDGAAVPAAQAGLVRVRIDAPAATVSATDLSTASSAAHTFTVTYVDGGGTDGAGGAGGGGGIGPSVDSNDLRVTGPAGFNAAATLVSFTGAGSAASPLVATYRVAGPAGGWSAAANGTYYVVAQPDEVTDNDGNALPAGAIGLFRVGVDVTPPLAWALVAPITSPATGTRTINVSYSDVSGVNASTLDGNDIRVIGPNGFSQLLPRGAVVTKATAASVDYALAPPAGGWKSRHNGTYSVVLQPGEVADKVGNTLSAARTITTFAVSLDAAPPTATVGPVSPDPRTTPVSSVTITFNEVVTGFNLGDVTLTRDGVAVPLAGAGLSSGDGKTYTLAGLANHTGPAGTYVLTVVAAGSGIEDGSGNAMAANAGDTWVNDLAGPRVSGVFVGSTGWASAFNNFLGSSGAGEAAFGFRVADADQLNELPWTNLNKVSVRFNEPVGVQQGDLVVRGLKVPVYDSTAFAYDAATFTATWTLGTTLTNERVTLDLDADAVTGGVADAVGNALDGEWADPADPAVSADTFPSGDGLAGGDFRFRMHVLPGDVTRNGNIQGNDVTLVRNAQGSTPGGAAYTIFKDVNGSANIQGNDVTLVRNRQGTTVPAPVAPAVAGRAVLQEEPAEAPALPQLAAPVPVAAPVLAPPPVVAPLPVSQAIAGLTLTPGKTRLGDELLQGVVAKTSAVQGRSAVSSARGT